MTFNPSPLEHNYHTFKIEWMCKKVLYSRYLSKKSQQDKSVLAQS